jgi:hypothetical protein
VRKVPYVGASLPLSETSILAPVGCSVITCSRSPPCQPLTTVPPDLIFLSRQGQLLKTDPTPKGTKPGWDLHFVRSEGSC